MGKVAKFSEDVARRAGQPVKTAKTTKELRTAMTVLIPRKCGINKVTTARVLGVGVATVVRMQREIRSEVAGNKKTKGRWGGRRRQHLTEGQEREFLEPWESIVFGLHHFINLWDFAEQPDKIGKAIKTQFFRAERVNQENRMFCVESLRLQHCRCRPVKQLIADTCRDLIKSKKIFQEIESFPPPCGASGFHLLWAP